MHHPILFEAPFYRLKLIRLYMLLSRRYTIARMMIHWRTVRTRRRTTISIRKGMTASRSLCGQHLAGVSRMCTSLWIWVGSLVLKTLNELVENGCDEGAGKRSDPIDPVIGGELMDNNSWTEGTCWVEGAAGPEHTCKGISDG